MQFWFLFLAENTNTIRRIYSRNIACIPCLIFISTLWAIMKIQQTNCNQIVKKHFMFPVRISCWKYKYSVKNNTISVALSDLKDKLHRGIFFLREHEMCLTVRQHKAHLKVCSLKHAICWGTFYTYEPCSVLTIKVFKEVSSFTW